MKLLLDQNISYRAVKKLSAHYAEVIQIGRIGMAQTPDAMIWQYALVNDYVIVTFDDYFQERNVLSGMPMKIILLRLQDTSTDHLIQILVAQKNAIEAFFATPNQSCLVLSDNATQAL